MSYSRNKQNILTVGPMFPVATARATIAKDLFTGINRMTAAGNLQRQAPAITEVLAQMKEFSESKAHAFLGRLPNTSRCGIQPDDRVDWCTSNSGRVKL